MTVRFTNRFVNPLLSPNSKPEFDYDDDEFDLLDEEFELEERYNPYTPDHDPPNPYNPLNWLRLFQAMYINFSELWIERKPLAWEKVDMYPHVAAYRPKPRPRLLRFLLFFLIFLLPVAIHFWGHRWGVALPHPIALLAAHLPPLVELPSWTTPLSVPFCEWTLGPFRPVHRVGRIRHDYWWVWYLLFYGDTLRCWLSALVHARLHFYWYTFTPAHFTHVLHLTLIFLVLWELFAAQIPQNLWEQLVYWPRIRDVPEVLPLAPGPPVRWFLYNLRLGFRNFTIEEQQWAVYFEAPEDQWSPEKWRRWEVLMTALSYPVYASLCFGWWCIRLPLLLLAPLIYPFRLLWLLDQHHLKLVPGLLKLVGATYLALLSFTLRPLNPLAGYLYPPLAARWEQFNTYYWRHWWDQFIYEPIYDFVIKSELQIDFLEGEWLPQEETENGWWLRMVRDRRYHFRLYRRLLGWYFWFPLRPLVLPFTVAIKITNAAFIRPVFTFPVAVAGSYVFKSYRRWRRSGSTIPLLLENPLDHPQIQPLWLPSFLALEALLRRIREWVYDLIWSGLLPFLFREVRPRIRFLRQVVLPWVLLPLALAFVASPVALWFSGWFPYKPHASEMLLVVVSGIVLVGLLPPFRRWAYWDQRYLLPLLLAGAFLDMTMNWRPRIWNPSAILGMEFQLWLFANFLPWLLAPLKPLFLFPFLLPLTLATVIFPVLVDFVGTFPVLGEALLRLLGSWFYLIWGWWLELIWQWLLWPILAKPCYHIDLWYYYALKPALKPLFPLLPAYCHYLLHVFVWLVTNCIYWPFWCYWMLPDILWTSANTLFPSWFYHLLYDGWCPFPLLQDPRPPSTTPYWDPRWIKPQVVTNPKFVPPLPWPPPPFLENRLSLY